MIDIKELRIGDWVGKTDEPNEWFESRLNPFIQVETISKTGINAVEKWDEDKISEGHHADPHINELEFGQIFPIEITPELLLKIGFVETYKSQWIRRFDADELGIGQIGYTFYHDRPHAFRYYSDTNANCKYLHQLQNLVFVLTGKELEFTS